MRNEKEMMDLILDTAKQDDRIRAVYMNGSRTNQNVPKDIFQDYDIVYVVKENKPFYEDKSWIDRFGERMYMQCPDELDRSVGMDVDFDKCYGWLIQFQDGNRIDLHVLPVEEAQVLVLEDKLCIVLLDKDGLLPAVSESSDEDYRVKRPTQNEFSACCNEFWWCLNNIAKGLWREEIPYVHQMLYGTVHPQLVKLLNWKIGYETNFTVSTGKASKYMKRYLPEEQWNRFLDTYANASLENLWNAVFVMCDLFQDTARELVKYSGYRYNEEEAEASYGYLRHVRTLPKDAEAVY